MKKTLFVLPFCLFLAFCSHKTVPPAPTGISNVSVKNEDGSTASASTDTEGKKDWGYNATRSTALAGNWTMEGMLAADGTWYTPASASSSANATAPASTDTAMAVAGSPAKTGGKGKGKNQKGNKVYDDAKARLNMDYKSGSTIDTTAPEPYKYWTRTPSLTITNSAFTGNTGCNSMSGIINYNTKDLEFSRVNTSKMACNEYNESNFLSLLQKANSYTLNGDLLEVRQGSTLLMRWKKAQ